MTVSGISTRQRQRRHIYRENIMGVDIRRFMGKFTVGHPSGCFEWTASKSSYGYGQISFRGRPIEAHRFAYALFNGETPITGDIDHLCRNPGGVNPTHLEAVSHRDNCRRGDVGRHNLDKTHCPQGHPYAGENLRVGKDGRRFCKACSRLQAKRRAS